MISFEVASEVYEDLFDIWRYIAQDSVALADRIEREFYELFDSLGRMPGQGHRRLDMTTAAMLFFPLHSYLVVYDPKTKPVKLSRWFAANGM